MLPYDRKNPLPYSYFRSGRRSPIFAGLRNKGNWSPKRIETLVSILLEPQLRVSTHSSFFRKPQSNASPLAERTLQLNLRMMQRRTMLDN